MNDWARRDREPRRWGEEFIKSPATNVKRRQRQIREHDSTRVVDDRCGWCPFMSENNTLMVQDEGRADALLLSTTDVEFGPL